MFLMNDNIDPSIFVIVGVISVEIGGFWLIRWSQRFPDPLYMKKLSKLACILGLIALILVLIDIWS